MPWHYYNEIDPYACAWLRNLIGLRLIPDGEIDSRSIADVEPEDLAGFVQCHFFAGIGGWPLALQLAGWPADRPVWTGSCPCQPFSAAGKRKGTADERHLWPEFFRLIIYSEPPVVFGEQVASKDGREWLAGVRADLEAVEYAVGAADMCTAGVSAPHIRQRLWWGAGMVADADGGKSGYGYVQSIGKYGLQPEDGGTIGGVADPRCVNRTGWRGVGYLAQEKRTTQAAKEERQWVRDTANNGGVDGGLANFPHHGRDQIHQNAGGGAEGNPTQGWPSGFGLRGTSDRLANRLRPRLEERPSQPSHPGPQFPATERSSYAGWSNSTPIPCLDGKIRRAPEPESGLFPLAHGVSGRVVIRRPAGEAFAALPETHEYSRVGALRGFGNAIVPELAAEFIQAFEQSCRDLASGCGM